MDEDGCPEKNVKLFAHVIINFIYTTIHAPTYTLVLDH